MNIRPGDVSLPPTVQIDIVLETVAPQPTHTPLDD